MVVKNKKFGFTLAEIMLTLSMIGILATLTVSTIGSSIQQRARLSEFRTLYSRLETALRNITIDESKIYRCYYLPSNDDKTDFGLTKVQEGIAASNADCGSLEDALSKALGRTKVCASKPTTNKCIPNNYPPDGNNFNKNGGNSRAYVLDNGMILWLTDDVRLFAVDINGRSAPNRWGQDIFPFAIKVTETKKIGDKIYPVAIGVLPPTGATQPAVTNSGKTTSQMLKESANYKK